jgi:hypothetical protein
MDKIPLKYRTWLKGIAPRPIKLALPGWAGSPSERGDGARAQPWHCLPFVEGSTYGLELLYPFDTECRISLTQDGTLKVDADYSREEPPLPESPVSVFAPGHYGMAMALDIQPPAGCVLRLEPHPRYFTDTTHTTPCCVPGHLQSEWWPKLFFAVFKNPPPGHMHIFRKGEPYAQLLVVPRRVSYEVTAMTPEEAQARIERDQAIMRLAKHYLENAWIDNAGHPFNDKYKVLSRVFASEGEEGIRKLLEAAHQQESDATKHLGFKIISG